MKASGKRETYLWGNLQWVEKNYEFSLAGGSHSSGNLINLAQTNGLAIVPVGTKVIDVGEEVETLEKHLSLLEEEQLLQNIYETLSFSIIKSK